MGEITKINPLPKNFKGIIMTLTFPDVSLLVLTLFIHWRMGKFFFERIKNIKKIVPTHMEWISVKDRLPEYDEQVICFDPNHAEAKIYVVRLQKENSYEIDVCKLGGPECWVESSGESYFTWKPTHWMPLPLKPETM